MAEHDVVDVGRVRRRGQKNEEKTEGQRGGEHGTHRDVALAAVSRSLVKRLDANCCERSREKEAHDRVDSEENRSRRSREAYIGETMAGQALAPKSDEFATEAG